jgi:hypothetical protein
LPGELEKERAIGDIKLGFEKNKPRVVAPGSSVVEDGAVTVTAPGKELDPSAVAVNQARTGYYNAMAKKASEMGLGKTQSTAFIQNLQYMIDSGIASDPADAFKKWKTQAGRSPSAAAMQILPSLLRDPHYRGADGRQRAIADSKSLVDAFTEDPDTEDVGNATSGAQTGRTPSKSYTVNGRSFTDADIEYTARQRGLTVGEVKRRLGVR